MSAAPQTVPVRDSIAKVNDEFAVGSDLQFQARWERFERVIWIVLTAFIALSLAGFFGRGPAARRQIAASDGSMQVRYERIQRFGTPSVLTISYPASSIHDGIVQLWVSESLTRPLGTQRVIPQPIRSAIGLGGILYTFDATAGAGTIEFQTQPTALGSTELRLRIADKSEVKTNIFVMP